MSTTDKLIANGWGGHGFHSAEGCEYFTNTIKGVGYEVALYPNDLLTLREGLEGNTVPQTLDYVLSLGKWDGVTVQ